MPFERAARSLTHLTPQHHACTNLQMFVMSHDSLLQEPIYWDTAASRNKAEAPMVPQTTSSRLQQSANVVMLLQRTADTTDTTIHCLNYVHCICSLALGPWSHHPMHAVTSQQGSDMFLWHCNCIGVAVVLFRKILIASRQELETAFNWGMFERFWKHMLCVGRHMSEVVGSNLDQADGGTKDQEPRWLQD